MPVDPISDSSYTRPTERRKEERSREIRDEEARRAEDLKRLRDEDMRREEEIAEERVRESDKGRYVDEVV